MGAVRISNRPVIIVDTATAGIHRSGAVASKADPRKLLIGRPDPHARSRHWLRP
jgi:hypothetical protein